MKKNKKFLALPVCFLLVIALLTGGFFLLPRQSFAENEKRSLSAWPDFQWRTLFDGSYLAAVQSYIDDHVPFREGFVGLHAYLQQLLLENGDSGVYRCKNGFLIVKQGEIELAAQANNLQTVHTFAKAHNLPLTWMLVPCSGAMCSDVLPKLHAPYRDDALLDAAKAACKKDTFLDVRAIFAESDPKTLYYKTDHHLTSQGALLLYDAYCKEKRLPAQSFSLLQSSDSFYGSAYSKSGLWLTKPDHLDVWGEPDGDYTVTLTDGARQKHSDSLYFFDHLDALDQYPVFLDGNHGLVTIQNNRCRNGKHLLLLKDSFAHCFACLLAANYETITMVDLRYCREPLQQILDTAAPQELLVLYGAENFASSTDLAWLSVF